MLMMPTMIKIFENAGHALSPTGQSAASTDRAYYNAKLLSPGEEQKAMLDIANQTAHEGSIFVIKSGPQDSYNVFTGEKKAAASTGQKDKGKQLSGLDLGKAVAQALFEDPTANANEIEAVAIAGCASSPLGTAAFGKQVAEIISKQDATTMVAAINAGQGAFDKLMEVCSGGMLMAPMANVLNTFDQVLEVTAKLNNVAAKLYMHELMDSMHEAATLYALLEARLLGKEMPKLNMIVSHSKGNWAVLVALINIELDLADKITPPKQPIIDVVTFGNPVDLPSMHPVMKKVFRYHQYVGELDDLAHKCSWRAWMLNFGSHPMIDPMQPFGPNADKDQRFNPLDDSDERLFKGTDHHLFAKSEKDVEDEPKYRFRQPRFHEDTHEVLPVHMPIEKILPMVREAARSKA